MSRLLYLKKGEEPPAPFELLEYAEPDGGRLHGPSTLAKLRLATLEMKVSGTDAYVPVAFHTGTELSIRRFTANSQDAPLAVRGEGVAGAAGAAGVAGPHEIRQRFITYLKESNINRPNEEVLNRLERYFPAHLIACSSAANALNLYADAKALPGSSTKAHLLTQLGLRVNGPYFVKGDGPVSLLQASTSYGRPSVLKLLERQHPASHGLYGEAKAVQALYDGKPTSVALASCEVLELHLSEEHEGTGHAPGMYRALLMPCYITSVARALPLSPSVLAAQGRKMAEALEWIHSKGWVHMDVKGDNIFIDSDGRWWLGDFGSAVQQGEPIKSTTQWFMPCKWVCGKNVADPKYDWHMLTVALLCELHKDTWKEVLIEDGYAPLHKLEAAISGTPVTADTADLVAFLNHLLKRSSS